MDTDLAEKITKNRESFGKTVKESSLKVYISNLKKTSQLLNDGKEVAGYDWLTDSKKVISILESDGKIVRSYQTVRNYLNAIILYLYVFNHDNELDDLIKEYETERDKLNQQYDDMNSSGLWSKNQEQNMLTKAEFNKVLADMAKEIKFYDLKTTLKPNIKQTALLQSYIILIIHSALPMRNELGNCRICYKRDYNKECEQDKNKLNYLIIDKNKMFFSLNEYKTNKIYSERYIEIPPQLKSKIRFWLRFIPGDKYLFSKKNGEALGTNGISQLLTKQFKARIGKSVSTTLLRKLFLSEKYLPIKKELMKDNLNMGHSASSAMKYYVKENPNDESQED